MLYWTLLFVAVAFAAGVLGFGGVAAGAAGMAKILCVGLLIYVALGAASRALRPAG